MADRPLSPATRRRLGELLPHQLADRTQAPPLAGSYALYSHPARENPKYKFQITNLSFQGLSLSIQGETLKFRFVCLHYKFSHKFTVLFDACYL